MSERTVGGLLRELFDDVKNRIIVATFASNIHRVQQIIDAAVRFGRKVASQRKKYDKCSQCSNRIRILKCS